MKIIKSIYVLTLIGFLFSCGDDFTDDYNKLKEEYDKIADEKKALENESEELKKQKDELDKKNQKLKDYNLKSVQENQETVVTNFITNMVQLMNGERLFDSSYQNVFVDGKFINTIVKYAVNDFYENSGQINLPVQTTTYVHKTNEDGVIVESNSDKLTISYGWDNGNCVKIVVNEKGYLDIYEMNSEGALTFYENSTYKTKLTYNENGNLTSSVKTKKSSKEEIERFDYSYTDTGKIYMRTKHTYGKKRYTCTYEYEDDRTIYHREHFSSVDTDEVTETLDQIYDVFGNILLHKHIQSNRDDIVEATYANGKLVTYKSEYFKKKNGVRCYGHKYEYTNIKSFDGAGLSLEIDGNGVNIKIGILNSYTKKYYKYTELSNPIDGLNYETKFMTHQDVVNCDKDKSYNMLSEIRYDEDGKKMVSVEYSNFFAASPCSPQKKVETNFTAGEVTKTYVNKVNSRDAWDWEWELQN